jgi:hypothetical protein
MAICSKDRSAAYRKRLKDAGDHVSKVIIFKNEIEVIDQYRSMANCGLSRNELIQSIVSSWIEDVRDELPKFNPTQEI